MAANLPPTPNAARVRGAGDGHVSELPPAKRIRTDQPHPSHASPSRLGLAALPSGPNGISQTPNTRRVVSPVASTPRLTASQPTPSRSRYVSKTTVENGHVVLILDDDDDDDDDDEDTRNGVQASRPGAVALTPAPRPPTAAAPSSAAQPTASLFAGPIPSAATNPRLASFNIASISTRISPPPLSSGKLSGVKPDKSPPAPAAEVVSPTISSPFPSPSILHPPAGPPQETPKPQETPERGGASRQGDTPELGDPPGLQTTPGLQEPAKPDEALNPNKAPKEPSVATKTIGPLVETNEPPKPAVIPKAKKKPRDKTEQPKPEFGYNRLSALTSERRPYLSHARRKFLGQSGGGSLPSRGLLTARTQQSATVHVDFMPDEVGYLLDLVRHMPSVSLAKPKKKQKKESLPPIKELARLIRSNAPLLSSILRAVGHDDKLRGRTPRDVGRFLGDIASRRILSTMQAAPPHLLTLQRRSRREQEAGVRAAQLGGLLLAREVAGHCGLGMPALGRTRQLCGVHMGNRLRVFREDSLRVRNEWTNCAGDISTVTWTSDRVFLCGTTTHMDARNHQYNRQGNLVLGSVDAGTLRAYPDHRIVRARHAGQAHSNSNSNSNSNHNRNDDVWLYTSVVSSDYDTANSFVFTAGFDHTVKVWSVGRAGDSMALMGTWRHDGKVQFVVASSQGLVATGADVAAYAVRIYRLPSPETGPKITYKSLSCTDHEGRTIQTDKWAYFPASMRWGLTSGTRHLLLVGYSPRGLSLTSDDTDIPEDRRNSGELLLFDGHTGEKWRIIGGTSQNVFEVAWHPTQPCFAVATSPVGLAVEEGVRTQIRIFRPSKNKEFGGRAYNEVHILDCYADDINELALLPNSLFHLYVAVGCTNGRTYVWDTSQGDKPLHELAHGPCIEETSGDQISVEDTGVKFVAWGSTPDRLYTGSSDGLVKVWNVRTKPHAKKASFVRDLLECPASVSCGAFSPDKSKLIVGDASGRVFLLSVEEGEDDPEAMGPIGEEDGDDDDDGSKEDQAQGGVRKNGEQEAMGPSTGLPKRPRRGPFSTSIQNTAKRRAPAPGIIRHATPPPPPGATTLPAVASRDNTPAKHDGGGGGGGGDLDAAAIGRAYLQAGQLVLHPSRVIGAVQGPNYAQTGLYCKDCHLDGDPQKPLLAQFDRDQQQNRYHGYHAGDGFDDDEDDGAPSARRVLGNVFLGSDDEDEDDDDVDMDASDGPAGSRDQGADMGSGSSHVRAQSAKAAAKMAQVKQTTQALHQRNLARDLDIDALPEETRRSLEQDDRCIWQLAKYPNYAFDYEDI